MDPTLLRAACGFWSGTVQCSTDCENTIDIGNARVSLKRRMEIWTNLTCHGFQGRVLATLEKQFFERKKFNVVEICRNSDVESQFNVGALQPMANCESGKKKYTRGLLCSDATLRWTGRAPWILKPSYGRRRKCMVLGRCGRKFSDGSEPLCLRNICEGTMRSRHEGQTMEIGSNGGLGAR